MGDYTPDGIVEHLKHTRKYRNCADQTLRRIAESAVARYGNSKDALKAAKRKLHQVYGAYFERVDLEAIERTVAGFNRGMDDTTLRAGCLEILRLHASTAERTSILDEVFPAIFQVTGMPRAILDLACGLNPFALPWMGLPATARYHAVDIDHRLVGVIGAFFAVVSQAGSAYCQDILVSLPETGVVDVAFLFKALPCLEQQEKSASRALLERIPARYVVVSFPTKSLGGKSKGMHGHYGAFMRALLAEFPGRSTEITFPGELLFVIEQPM